MSFILLGKHSDDRVVLLSEEVYLSRKDATEALSGLTSEASFAHWDAEVFVVDIDTATPVLLVRPAASPTAMQSEVEPVDEEPLQHTGSDVGEPDEDTESLVVEEAAVEPEAQEAAGDVDLSAALTELGIGDDESVTEEAVGQDVDEEVEQPAALGDDDEGEEGSALRDAIARTTAQMAASGIVPPESVGSDSDAADDGESLSGDAEDVDDTEAATEGEALEVPTGEPVSEDAKSWPWAPEEDGDSESGFTLSALEDPGVDEGSLVKAAGDDETMDFARPVILGDYDDIPAAEPMSIAMAEALATQAEEDAGEDESASEDLAAALAAAMAETAAVSEPEAQSDQGSADPAVPAASPADGLTCDDCVYFQTCPNKEDREPSSCGSFQWK